MPAVSSSMGVLAPLLTKLATLLSDKYKQLNRVRKNIEFLSHELTEMNAVLEKLADVEKLDGQQKLWRNDVREMAYDIEDCIDVFMCYLGNGDNKDGLLKRTARELRKLRARYQITNKIQELKARVIQVAERRDRYINLGESTSNLHKVVEVDPRLPALYEDEKNLVGIVGPCKETTQWLMKKKENSLLQQLKVLSIVGDGGIGKTTLAKQVYNELKKQFDCTSFVSVSQNPDMVMVLKNLLSGIGFHDYGILDDHQKLIDTLRGHLAKKRYLVVVDDIWSTKPWSIIRCAFAQSNSGSRVVITTRIEDVATNCCFGFHGMVYKMEPLNEFNSQRLFCKRIFDSDSIPEKYKKVSEDMLRKCKGLPLAIVSIASLLASQGMHVKKWEKIHDYMISELETNPTLEWMRHVLNLSYLDLSHDLKTCFLYLGIYPEDHIIFKDDLIKLWIAEGFILEKPGLYPEETAESYFNELINRSMIKLDNYRRNEAVSCHVHDLMLDFIISKCQEENFITIVSKQSVMNASELPVRRLCHQLSYKNLAMEKKKLSQVRSYITFPACDYSLQPPISMFVHLRVLDLRAYSTSIFLDLSDVCNLFLLRHLSIRGFKLKMPQKIGGLQCLRTLDLLDSLLVTEIPSDVISLSSLHHLTVSGDAELPSGIQKMTSLQTLLTFKSRGTFSHIFTTLGKFQQFNSSVISLAKAHRSTDGSLRQRSSFTVHEFPFDDGWSTESVLNQLSQHLDSCPPSACHLNLMYPILVGCSPHILSVAWPCLQRLIVRKNIPSVPIMIGYALELTMLELHVEELRCNDFQHLAGLPCLVDLDLTAQATPENIIIVIIYTSRSPSRSRELNYPNNFPKLQKFILTCDLPCLTFKPGTMPQLQILKLHDKKLSNLDKGRGAGGAVEHGSSPLVGIEHLPMLEEIHVTTHSSKESAYRDAVQRHPKIQDTSSTFNICDGSIRTKK
uniref:AAA+ ATPase domain-containing protein n=1 Tax=Leersia perrieri TaxID=77586 RepID=A0A0D9XZ64_9ORYZ